MTKTTMDIPAAAANILGGRLTRFLGSMFDTMEWAEEEIAAAQRRHRRHRDRLWHSFMLLRPMLESDAMRSERVYRSHCRELLERVATGADTRPATAAECCVAMCEVSLAGPLTTTAVGLYARMFDAAGLPSMDLDRSHYEALKGSQIDDAEVYLRRHLTQYDRVLPDPIEHKKGCPHTQSGAPTTPPPPKKATNGRLPAPRPAIDDNPALTLADLLASLPN